MIASRVAAQLSKENDVEIKTVKGGLGELSVYIDQQRVIDTNRLWYPMPGRIVRRVQELLSE
jgi:hypothetical protein